MGEYMRHIRQNDDSGEPVIVGLICFLLIGSFVITFAGVVLGSPLMMLALPTIGPIAIWCAVWTARKNWW